MVRAYHKPASIFVNVASYRDPECSNTIIDMMVKARHPEEITVGLVLQSEPEDDAYPYPKSVRTLAVKASESRGACWARSMGYRLWDGQDYILQIDSHMRFAQDWDVKMLAQLTMCPTPSRALLTTYPPPYEPGAPDLVQQTIYLAAVKFGPDGYLSQIGQIHNPAPALPRPTALMSGNFLFGRAGWIADVPYDPHLYFSGEEPTLAARLWTHGWDMFGPTEPVVWHRYGREGRRLHWDDHARWYVPNALSVARANHLLGGTDAEPDALVEIERYGMGTVRTLAAYQEWSGINFAARTLAPHALTGDWS